MTNRNDWRMAAINQKARADRLDERETDLLHALNLLVNDVVEWFAEYRTVDDARHQFGIGVAMNVEPVDDYSKLFSGGKKENRGIVFWKTTFPQGNKYVTVYSIDDFKTYPERYYRAAPEVTKPDSVVELVVRARELVDDAYQSYVSRRREHRAARESPVM